MRKFSSAVITLVALGLTTATGQQNRPSEYIPGQILVQFHPAAPAARRNNALALRHARPLRHFAELDIDSVQLDPGQTVEAAVAALRGDPDVLQAQPDYVRTVVASGPPNDPLWLNDTLWGLQKIQAQGVWNSFTTGSSSFIVADIDTGINYNHPDLAANVWTNPGEIPGNGIDDDHNGYVDDVHGINVLTHSGDPMDDNGHGTHTAGTIGAAGNNGIGVVGVAWNTRILSCKFLSSTGSGSDSGAAECLNYVVALKKSGVDIRVTSNSWGAARGGGISTVLKSAFDAAGSAGILNICAAGNAGTNNDTTPFDPASLPSPSIVSVAASDQSDNKASFSNYGTSVHLAAPGVSIASTYGSDYAYMSGTSMATPHVAGAVALLSAINPALTPDTIKTLLMSTVDVLPQWAGLVASGGRLNVLSAAMAAGSAQAPLPPPPPPPAPPAAPNMPPIVSITSPSTGATVGTPLTITASASDPDGTIFSVSFYANGVFLKSDGAGPYAMQWSNPAPGTYVLTAVAADNQGATTTSAPVTVTVKKKR
jgi:subtilisin family serine protease